MENGLGKEVGNLHQGVNVEAMVIRQVENEEILAYGNVNQKVGAGNGVIM